MAVELPNWTIWTLKKTPHSPDPFFSLFRLQRLMERDVGGAA